MEIFSKKFGFKIKKVGINGPLILAPMAGVLCNAYFRLAEDFGANLIYSGMIDADKVGVLSWKRIKEIYLDFDNSKTPFVAQIIGGINSIEKIKKLTRFLEEQENVDIIDLNVGCPLKEQIQKGAGAGLLKNVEDIIKILKTIKQNTTKPITIKLRSGLEETNVFNVVEKIKPYVDAIAIHPKTQKMKYGGVPDYDLVKKIVESVDVPVFVSGGILKPGSARFALEKTKAKGVMFARGVIGNPYLIKRTKYLLENGKNMEELNWKTQKEIINKFCDYYLKQKNKPISFFIQHIKWFLKYFPKEKEVKKLKEFLWEIDPKDKNISLEDLVRRIKKIIN